MSLLKFGFKWSKTDVDAADNSAQEQKLSNQEKDWQYDKQKRKGSATEFEWLEILCDEGETKLCSGLLQLPLRGYLLRAVRQYATKKVDKGALKELRNRTGIAFSNCKKALQQFDNNVEEAEKWLNEQAQKEGWEKVSKVQNRPMSQGLVAMVFKPDCATVIEVNCETDFVAKNQKFQELVARLTNVCHNHFNKMGTNATYSKGALNALTEEDKTLADLVAMQVGTIGENMLLRRGMFHKAGIGNHLATYIHSIGPKIQIGDVHMGKFTTTVEVSPVSMAADPDEDFKKLKIKSEEEEEGTEIKDADKREEQSSNLAKGEESSPGHDQEEELSLDSDSEDEEEVEKLSMEEVGNKVCLHIVGMNPKVIGVPVDSTPSRSKDDEQALIYQDFLLEESLTVGKFLYKNGYSVTKFTRYECGEEIKEEGEDVKEKETSV